MLDENAKKKEKRFPYRITISDFQYIESTNIGKIFPSIVSSFTLCHLLQKIHLGVAGNTMVLVYL